MSLLMEALKKAEQAKQKAAAAGEAAPVSQPSPASALTLELTPTEVPTPKSAAAPAPMAPPAAPPEGLKFTTIAERAAPVAEPPKPVPTETRVESAPVIKPIVAPQPTPPAPVMTAASQPRVSAVAATSGFTTTQRTSRIMLWSLLGVVVMLMLGGGGYWYYDSMSAFLQNQTTRGMPQAEIPAEVPPPVEPAAIAESANKIPVAQKPAAAKSVPKSVAVVPVPMVPATAAPAAPAPINVSRNVDQAEIFNSLQQAYRHYQNGDDARAQVLYARVLEHEENNRDALLGLAAIAVRQRDTLKAQTIYSELLALDPRDTVAQAGFFGVTRSLDPLQQEARVKQMLDQEPNAPHLLFTYATFLMQQQRWAEASRVLFSAHQSQRDNPDYAFNLAVTFDHQRQNENALTYYRIALDLAGKQTASFHAEDARRRIAALQAPRAGDAP